VAVRQHRALVLQRRADVQIEGSVGGALEQVQASERGSAEAMAQGDRYRQPALRYPDDQVRRLAVEPGDELIAHRADVGPRWCGGGWPRPSRLAAGITTLATIPLAGGYADRYGIPKVLGAAFGLLIAGVISGTARNMPVLVLGGVTGEPVLVYALWPVGGIGMGLCYSAG
jgi:hypothetical protein